MKLKSFLATAIATSLLVGCGANTTQGAAEGAAVGAVSAGMLGALTDLIVDGEVDTYRLSRNVTAGALAGGTAGAIDGYSKDQKEEAQSAQPAPSKPALEFGPDVETSIGALVACQHDDAYRAALKAEQASQQSYKEAGVAMQALIDYDRGNEQGVDRAVDEYVKLSSTMNDANQAKTQLEALHKELQQEREIAGSSPTCG